MKIDDIMKIADESGGGFTINLETGEHVLASYAVAYKETQGSFGTRGAVVAMEHAGKNDGYLGGWLNTEDGRYYFDSVMIFDNESEAIEAGRREEQIAIYNIHDSEEIRL